MRQARPALRGDGQSSSLRELYSGEERLRLAVWLFSLLAVLLSLVGIWGQVLMDVQYKRMEISVKRVFGPIWARLPARACCCI